MASSSNVLYNNSIPVSSSTAITENNIKEPKTILSPLSANKSSQSFVNIIFDSLFINNNRVLFGNSAWNFTVNVNNNTIDLLTLEKVKDNQTIRFHGKNISLLIPTSKNLHISSQPFVIKPSGKWDLLDYFGRDYNSTNNFGKGNHIVYPTNGKETTLHFNILNYKYSVKINKDPDYVLKYHIQSNFSKLST